MIRAAVVASTTVFVAVFCIVVFGAWSYLTLPREASPDITIPVVMVTTPYFGVAPADIETLVTNPIENEIAGLRDIKEMRSTSSEGISLVTIEFEPDVVIEDALQRVRDRVNRAKSGLPADVEEPAIREISFSDIPVLIVTIAGDVDEETLKNLGEDLAEDVSRTEGVLDARLSGGLTREVRVQLDPARLSHYGLSMRDVIGAISAENVNIPGGNVKVDKENILLRTPGQFDQADDLENVAVKRVGGRPVLVRDLLANRIRDGFSQRSSYARMNGQPAVSLSVTKRGGANIVGVADAVKEIAKTQSASWPDGVRYEILADQSVNIENMVTELQNNIATALALVVAVILFFMGLRNSFFVALAIPLSMLISFAVLQALGFTLNMIVLFSLILALGMLVDNAIVVVENIYRHMELGKPRAQAAIDGTREVAVAVAASTATTVAAFFPMVFWGGIMGEFMGYLPKTLIIVLLASLFVAVLILPVWTSRFMKPAKIKTKAEQEADDERVATARNPITKAYTRVLEASIRFRYVSLGVGLLALVATGVVYALFNHGTEFFPDTEPNRAIVDVRAPDGTDLETTDAIVRRIETVLAADPNVETFVAETGVSSGGGGALMGNNSNPQAARITVDFLPHWTTVGPEEAVRTESSLTTVEHLRASLQSITGAEIKVEKEEMGPPVGKPIAVEVFGADFHTTGALAQRVRRALAKVDGVTELADDYRVGRPEMALRVDRSAAKRIGVSTQVIGDTLRTAVAGTVATTLRDGDDEYDVVVELAPRYREDLQSVLDLRLPGREDTSPDTFAVPLSTVASYDLIGGTGSVRHTDQDMVITIEGDVREGFNEDAVKADVVATLEALKTEIPELQYGLAGANTDQEEAAAFLTRAFLIAVALITLVLVTQFDSTAMPVIILVTVMLSLIGVLWGLLLTGTPFGIMMTGIGVISLAGVVVNNAIVLLDYVQQLRRRGFEVREALVVAGLTRFRPVMLTAITTVLGLVPMALGITVDVANFRVLVGSQSAQWWGPMAVAVIFGLSFATILTLVMVPTLYGIYDDLVRSSQFLRRVAQHNWLGRLVFGAAPVAKVLAIGALGLSLLSPTASAASLQDAFRAAESNNLDIAAMRERVAQAENVRMKAWSLLSPRLVGAVSYNLNQYETVVDFTESVPPEFADFLGDSEPIVVQPKAFWQGSVTVSQSLFDASSIPALQASYRNVDATRLDQQRTQTMIRSAVARSYYAVAASRAALVIALESEKTAAGQLELAKRRADAGLGTRRDIVDAELRISQAARDVASARETIVSAEEALHTLTGLARDVEVELPDTPTVPATLEEAIAKATSARPDLNAAAARARSAALQRRARQLDWLPDVRANWTMIFTENQGFLGQSAFWVAGIETNWTLWDGGMRVAENRDASSNLRLAELEVERARQTAEDDVRQAWSRYERTQLALTAIERENELADESFTLAQRGLEAGLATWLEVQRAELVVRNSRLGTLRGRMDHDLAAIDLLVAMGTY